MYQATTMSRTAPAAAAAIHIINMDRAFCDAEDIADELEPVPGVAVGFGEELEVARL
jgi:hypothetical protein